MCKSTGVDLHELRQDFSPRRFLHADMSHHQSAPRKTKSVPVRESVSESVDNLTRTCLTINQPLAHPKSVSVRESVSESVDNLTRTCLTINQPLAQSSRFIVQQKPLPIWEGVGDR